MNNYVPPPNPIYQPINDEQSNIQDSQKRQQPGGWTMTIPNTEGLDADTLQNLNKSFDFAENVGGAVKDGQELKDNAKKSKELGDSERERESVPGEYDYSYGM